MKKTIKIYLELEDFKKLQEKAGNGRGSISAYISKVAREPIAFLDSNVRALLKAINLK